MAGASLSCDGEAMAELSMVGPLCKEGPIPSKQLEDEDGCDSAAVLTTGLSELEAYCLFTDETTTSALEQYLLASKYLDSKQCCISIWCTLL